MIKTENGAPLQYTKSYSASAKELGCGGGGVWLCNRDNSKYVYHGSLPDHESHDIFTLLKIPLHGIPYIRDKKLTFVISTRSLIGTHSIVLLHGDT